MHETVREVTKADVETTLEAIRDCGLFAPEEISTVAAQLHKTLAGNAERGEFWVADFNGSGVARGVAYCVEEVLTDRVWNLLFIGVSKDHQGVGIGSRLLRSVEDRLRGQSQRMVVVETTNGPEFDAAHAFYRRHAFSQEGTIRDFYADGADKIAFRKLL